MSMPVPGTGRSRWHRPRSRGVSANSKVLSHHYERGTSLRRLVRRLERRLWQSEMGDE